LRLHEEHNALIWAGRHFPEPRVVVPGRHDEARPEARWVLRRKAGRGGLGKRIEEELEAVAKEARTLDASRPVSGPANAALRAAALLAVKLAGRVLRAQGGSSGPGGAS
jgi:hypothetical protein